MRVHWLVIFALMLPVFAGFECVVYESDGDGDVDSDADGDADGDGFQPGDTCAYWLEYDDSYCSDGDHLVYCGTDDWVYEASCAGTCGGLGYCGFSTELGYEACLCPDDAPELPAVGAVCDWGILYPDYNACSSTVHLDYCDPTTGYVEQVDCGTLCSGGFCDYDWDAGYSNCMCPDWQWAPGYACNYIDYYDAGTCAGNELTYCAEDNVIYAADCDAYCMGDPYYATSGSCGALPGVSYNGCNCVYDACDFSAYCYDAQFLVYCDAAMGAVWEDCDATCVSDGFAKGACQTDHCECI